MLAKTIRARRQVQLHHARAAYGNIAAGYGGRMVGLLACDFLAALAGASVGVVQPVPVIGIIKCLDQGHHRIAEGVAHGVGFHAVNGRVPRRFLRARLDTDGQQDCRSRPATESRPCLCGQEGVVSQWSQCDSCQREYSSAKKGKVSRAIGTIRMTSADKSK